MLEALHHITNVDVVALEMPLEDHHRAIRYGPPGEIIHEQIDPHAGRQSHHRGQAQGDAVACVKNAVFRVAFGRTIKGDGLQRRLFGAILTRLADTISGVGRGIDNHLRTGCALHQRKHRVAIERLGCDRVLLA